MPFSPPPIPDQTPATVAPDGAALLEAFQAFPAALAMLGPDGAVTCMNDRFRQRFAHANLDLAAFVGSTDPGRGDWRALPQPGQPAAPLRARAIAAGRHWVVLVAEPAPGASSATRQRGGIARLQQRIRELEQQATTDHLTGAWNRAHLDQSVPVEIARSRRDLRPVSLMLFDIDHFKRVNDLHGHPAGDRVLRDLVALARRHMRASDSLFRWGGEEFVLLATGTGYRGSEKLAENLRGAVSRHDFGSAGPVTISIGVAEHLEQESPAEWFQRLDDALYAAKQGGRNRVVVDRRGSSDAWAAAGRMPVLQLAWHESYESGHPQIDADHQSLFRLANRLLELMVLEEPGSPALLAALDELLANIKAHFAHEEAVLAAHDYPRLEEHRRVHDGLLRRAAELRAMPAGDSGAPSRIIEFLARDVVVRHMIGADRQFYPLFAAAPAGPAA